MARYKIKIPYRTLYNRKFDENFRCGCKKYVVAKLIEKFYKAIYDE